MKMRRVVVLLSAMLSVTLAVCPEECVCRDGVVNCANKNLSHFPEHFPHDTIEIDLSSNKITQVSDDVFKLLPQLITLDLSKNLLETLSITPFVGLSSLQKLKLHNNPWVCDCRIKWMVNLVQRSVLLPPPLCQSPFSHRNQSVHILTSICDQSKVLVSSETIEDTVIGVRNQVNTMVQMTIHDMRRVKRSALKFHEKMKYNRYPLNNALKLSTAAEIFERTIEKLLEEIKTGTYYNISSGEQKLYKEVLTEDQLTLLSILSGCTEHRQLMQTCDNACFNQKYRTLSGVCNNLYAHQIMYGASNTRLGRLLPARYENNFNLPIGWSKDKLHNGHKIPSARKVSIDLLSSKKDTTDDQLSHMFTQWGQFLTHDIDLSPTAISNARFSDGRFCNESCVSASPCFPIPVDSEDPRITSQPCIGFVRSTSMCGTGITSGIFEKTEIHREQINVITSFIDASMVYGNTEEQEKVIRNMNPDEGYLKVGVKSNYSSWKPLLPVEEDSNDFRAGDGRANEQIGLTTIHTIWFREHNRLAKLIKTVNPNLDGKNIYHETRKIIGGMMQHITYEHWLPKVLGPSGMQKMGPYQGYKSYIDPSVTNAFASAAMRFGHSNVRGTLSRLGDDFQSLQDGDLMMHEAFEAPHRIVNEGGIDPILRGLFATPAKQSVFGDFFNAEMTERLFIFQNKIALDLASLNIQRGRDHGLPSYNSFRKLCGLREAVTFDDFSREISSSMSRMKLKELYGHPDNVDLYVGGLFEDSVEGGKVGQTFGCVLADQFKRLRDGDRFWYENPGVFKEEQLKEIKKSTLARLICENSDGIMKVQKEVFTLTTDQSQYLSCSSSDIPLLDIAHWSQCCEVCSPS